MEYTKLGKTDLTVSRVGFGCWALGGHGWGRVDEELAIASVRRALQLGITLFDTADVYGFGHSEEMLSYALGEDRHRVVIATKFGVTWDGQGRIGRDLSPGYLVKAVEASLRRLRIDCIPLYQMHWPDGVTPIAETMGALLKLQAEGKIRYIGCSNFPDILLTDALRTGRVESLQVPFSLIRREAAVVEAVAHCAAAGVGTVAYDVLGKGLLSGKFMPNTSFGDDDVRSRDGQFRGERFQQNLQLVESIRQLSAQYGKTPAQVAIRWAMDAPGIDCALVGVKRPEQALENAGVADWHLKNEDWEWLGAEAIRLGLC